MTLPYRYHMAPIRRQKIWQERRFPLLKLRCLCDEREKRAPLSLTSTCIASLYILPSLVPTVVLASIIGRLAQNKLFGLQGVKIC